MRPTAHPPRRLAGFTLLEFVVIVTFLVLLAGVLIPRVRTRNAAARDARRLHHAEILRDAIDRFHFERGYYPTPESNESFGGWDVSHDGDLIPELVEHGYIEKTLTDPIDDDTYHYRYIVYDEGAFRCAGRGAFYVLGIKNFETAQFNADHTGHFACPERDWSDEFAYVTGGGATTR